MSPGPVNAATLFPFTGQALPAARLNDACAELIAHGRAFRERAGAGPSCTPSEFLAWFEPSERYAARWPLRAILEKDDSQALAEVVSAGFPVDAPVGFQRGSPLGEAVIIGAEHCTRILLDLGADIERPNELLELPVELAMAEAALDSTRLPLLSLLHVRGARIDLAGRQASRQHAVLNIFGPDGPTQQVHTLGWIGLRELSNEWHGAQPFESSNQEAIQAALRLDSARRTLGLKFEEFLPELGSAFLYALKAHHLPETLGLCLQALHEHGALAEALPDFADVFLKASARRL